MASRITSYNVCYTKLLRIPLPALTAWAAWRIAPGITPIWGPEGEIYMTTRDGTARIPAGGSTPIPLTQRVEGVLDELLDHRGGTLDDLAGGDLVDQVTWELLDGHTKQRALKPAIFSNRRGFVSACLPQVPAYSGMLSVWPTRIRNNFV